MEGGLEEGEVGGLGGEKRRETSAVLEEEGKKEGGREEAEGEGGREGGEGGEGSSGREKINRLPGGVCCFFFFFFFFSGGE